MSSRGKVTSRKARRKDSWDRCNGIGGKKDRRVAKSSKGKFANRAELDKTRSKPGAKAHRKISTANSVHVELMNLTRIMIEARSQ